MEKMELDNQIHIITGRYITLNDIMPFPSNEKIELDMGCGKGGFSSMLAQRYPERMIFSADVMIGRLRKLVKRNKRLGIENITPLRVEARFLLSIILPDTCLDRMHVLCPDPWPKERHKKHRLLCSDFFGKIRRVLKNGGVFHFSSDDEQYCDSVRNEAEKAGFFTRDDSLISDLSDMKTDFEIRWNKLGKKVHHMAWQKKED